MKVAFLLLAAVACMSDAATILADVKSHDVTLGNVGDNDWILWNREVKVAGSWWPWSSVEQTFNYTVPSTPSDHPIMITAIRAMDKSPLGKGGYAKLISGGIGSDHVSLKFTSQEWQGIDFLVVIYGKVPA